MKNKALSELRRERKEIRNIITQLVAEGLPFNNHSNGPRRVAVGTLLAIAGNPKNPYIIPDLIKAALELLSYNDRVAKILLQIIVEEDYKGLIRKEKRPT